MRPDTHQQKHAEGRGRARQRTLLRVAAGVLLYVLGGALLHYVVAPEAAPPIEDYPQIGDLVVNERAGERVLFRRVPTEANDTVAVIDVVLAPQGAVPVAHRHEEVGERFEVLRGRVNVVVDGVQNQVGSGESIDVAPGLGHALSNPGPDEALVRVTMDPVGDLGLALVQVHGFLADGAEPPGWFRYSIQMLRFADRYDVHLAEAPVWAQRLAAFLVVPTARLLGVESYYEKYSRHPRERGLDMPEAAALR